MQYHAKRLVVLARRAAQRASYGWPMPTPVTDNLHFVKTYGQPVGVDYQTCERRLMPVDHLCTRDGSMRSLLGINRSSARRADLERWRFGCLPSGQRRTAGPRAECPANQHSALAMVGKIPFAL